jgi:predicted outer membrane repeat protein
VIEEFVLIRDVYGLTIAGVGDNVTITCSEGYGLAFVNVTHLNIEGVTIDRCGLFANQSFLQDSLQLVNESLNVFYVLPANSIVASVFANILNLQMNRVDIINTDGLAMLAINLIGNTYIYDVTFEKNSIISSPYQTFCSVTGGGLFILYCDYRSTDIITDTPNLVIAKSTFIENANCGQSFLYVQPDTVAKVGLTYNMTFSSGLALALTQLKFSVNTSVYSTSFIRNDGFAAGIGLSLFQGVHDSHITIDDCTFQDNTLSLGIQSNNLHPFLDELILNISDVKLNLITVKNTNILKAHLGVSILSFQPVYTSFNKQDSIDFNNCSISQAASAIIARSLQCYAFLPGLLVHMKNMHFFDIHKNFNGITFREAGVIVSYSLNITFNGHSVISNNTVPGIFAVNGIINVNGTLSFINNSAAIGGGLFLQNTFIVMFNNSALKFIRNSATIRGGAIFADLQPIGEEGYHLSERYFKICFISFDQLDEYYSILSTKPDLNNYNVSIQFIDNKAPLGSSIYGSSLQLCTWIPPFDKNNASEVFETLPFSFVPPIDTAGVINTGAVEMILNNKTIEVLPGEHVTLDVTAYDALGQSIPWVITSAPSNGPHQHNVTLSSTLGLSGYWLLPGDNHSLTNAYFNGAEEITSEFILLGVINSFPQVNFNVSFKACSVGFVFEDGKCVCSSEISDIDGVVCRSDLYCIETLANHWFGQDQELGFVYEECSLDYCESNLTYVNNNTDIQCNEDFGRTGLVCSECQPGYSATFGSNRCVYCSHYYLFTIPVFLILGLLLVLIITFLNITIADGYINGVIFFCDIISVYKAFFTRSISHTGYHLMFIPASFINLDVGFELCFYDGMTTLIRSAFYLFFPFYLFFLMIVITLIAKFSVKLSNITNSVPRSFATIFLLCFTNLGQTCVQIIAFYEIQGSISTYYGWYMAPNIPYLDPGHLSLSFIAIIILILLLVIAFFLLIPKLVMVLKLQVKFLPLLDPFWSPFKPKFRFWLSLRLFFRVFAFINAYLTPYPINCFVLALMCLGLLLFNSDLVHPFKGNLQNRLDHTFLMFLVVISFSSVFNSLTGNNLIHFYGVIVVLVMIASYAMFAVVIAIHLYLRFEKIQTFCKSTLNKLKEIKNMRFMMKKKIELKEDNEDNTIQQSNEHNFTSTTISIDSNMARLREPLLEDSLI